MKGFEAILVLAGISEAVWETIKMLWKNGKFNINKLGSVIIGILLCIITNADILTFVGFKVTMPLVAQILTGLLISRGANFISDIYGSIYNVQCKSKGKNENQNW